jgi:hypothetical protein
MSLPQINKSREGDMVKSLTYFVGQTISPFFWLGLAIPTIVMMIATFDLSVFSFDTGSKLCAWLDVLWPGTSSNYFKILDLHHPIEGSAYVLLVFSNGDLLRSRPMLRNI